MLFHSRQFIVIVCVSKWYQAVYFQKLLLYVVIALLLPISLILCIMLCWPIGELPKLCVKIRPDSWLVCGPFRCYREWRHEWQHGGLCAFWRSFGCVLLLDQIFRKQCTVWQYTTLIYLINLLWKLVLGLGLDSELHYFSIFTENKKNEHLIFCECHGR